MKYSLTATGTTFVFKDAASVRTVLLDLGVTVAEAVFNKFTLGYGTCILNAAAHSGAASLSEAPALVNECFPALVKGVAGIVPGLGWIGTAAQAIGVFVQTALISGDYVFDAALKRQGEVTIARTANWNNASYTMTCGGDAPQPFTVKLQDGKGVVSGSNPYSSYEIHIEAVTKPGDLTNNGNPETAVLLYCSPQPSNFFVEEVQVFKANGELLGELPASSALQPSNSPLPPLYNSSQFSIKAGQLITGMTFYAPTDSHASGPSVHQVVTWQWNGHQFVHSKLSLPQAAASPSCLEVSPGVPAGLASAVKQQIGSACGLEINNLKADPKDPSWVIFSISPTPGSLTQGGGGIAHEVNGAWPVVLTGSSQYWCDPSVPSQVDADFGFQCPQ